MNTDAKLDVTVGRIKVSSAMVDNAPQYCGGASHNAQTVIDKIIRPICPNLGNIAKVFETFDDQHGRSPLDVTVGRAAVVPSGLAGRGGEPDRQRGALGVGRTAMEQMRRAVEDSLK